MMHSQTSTTTFSYAPPQPSVTPVVVAHVPVAMPRQTSYVTSSKSSPSFYSSQPVTPVSQTYSLSQAGGTSNAKVRNFSIVMVNSHSDGGVAIYFTGQKLIASVNLDVRKKRLKVLRILFECIGESKLGIMSKRHFYYKKTLFPAAKKALHSSISGCQSFSIELDLPNDLMPSMESRGRFVKYYCQATVVRFREQNSIKAPVVPFLVYQSNTNFLNQLMEPQEPVEEVRSTDSLTMTCTINKSVFHMGENVLVDIDVANGGKKKEKLWFSTCVLKKTRIRGDLRSSIGGDDGEEINQSQAILLSVLSNHGERTTLANNLKSIQPTSDCPELSISYVFRVSITREKTLLKLKPKPKIIDFPIVIGWVPPDADIDTTPVVQHRGSRASLGRRSTSFTSRSRDPPPYPGL